MLLVDFMSKGHSSRLFSFSHLEFFTIPQALFLFRGIEYLLNVARCDGAGKQVLQDV